MKSSLSVYMFGTISTMIHSLIERCPESNYRRNKWKNKRQLYHVNWPINHVHTSIGDVHVYKSVIHLHRKCMYVYWPIRLLYIRLINQLYTSTGGVCMYTYLHLTALYQVNKLLILFYRRCMYLVFTWAPGIYLFSLWPIRLLYIRLLNQLYTSTGSVCMYMYLPLTNQIA